MAKPKEADQMPADMPEGYVEEQVGFPPYWKAENVGDSFFGRVIALDLRDPEFRRIIVEAGKDTPCARGPMDNQVPCVVVKGDQFSVSLYGGLQNAIEKFIDTEFPILCKIINKQKVNNQPSPMFVWQVMVHPSDKKLIAKRQSELSRLEAAQERSNRLPGASGPTRQETEVPFR